MRSSWMRSAISSGLSSRNIVPSTAMRRRASRSRWSRFASWRRPCLTRQTNTGRHRLRLKRARRVNFEPGSTARGAMYTSTNETSCDRGRIWPVRPWCSSHAAPMSLKQDGGVKSTRRRQSSPGARLSLSRRRITATAPSCARRYLQIDLRPSPHRWGRCSSGRQYPRT